MSNNITILNVYKFRNDDNTPTFILSNEKDEVVLISKDIRNDLKSKGIDRSELHKFDSWVFQNVEEPLKLKIYNN